MLNPRRISAFRALWRALRGHREPGAPDLGERARALPRLTGDALAGRYPGIGRGKLAMIVIALVYVVSPVDVVPELLLNVLGLTDDAVVGMWLAGTFLTETERYLRWRRTPPGVVDGQLG